MTSVKTTMRDGVYTVEVTGHAGHGPKGHDIVCAGISGACYVIAEGARALTAAGLADDADVHAGDGTFSASIRARGIQGRIAARCWMDAAKAAGVMLSAQYPEHVQVIGGGSDA